MLVPNKENIAKWAIALSSDEFKQGQHCLHKRNLTTGEELFCCLGVAVVTAQRDGVRLNVEKVILEDDDTYETFSYDDEPFRMPQAVQLWLGLDSNPLLYEYKPTSMPVTAIRANDGDANVRRNFREIASAIREKWLV